MKLANISARLRIAALGVVLVACNADRLVAPAPRMEVQATAGAALAAGVVVPPSVVISQVYGGGGNSGAKYKNDFIELYNPTSAAVSLSGWSVQYASSSGSSWNATALAGSIPAHGYYLVSEAAGSGGTTPLPTPDKTGGINMSGSAGKVILAITTTAQTGSCPVGGAVVDYVGFGGTNCNTASGWISNTAGTSNSSSAIRLNGGCTWSGAPGSDFEVIDPPTPRNSASPTKTCSPYVTISPAAPRVAPGFTTQLSAIGRDANGVGIASYTWTSADEAIATVADGLVKGITSGTVTVTASAGSLSATVSVVVETPVASVSLSPSAVTMTYNSTYPKSARLTATMYDDAGAEITPKPAVSWSSSDAAVASVSSSGTVTAKSAGIATITASSGGKTATAAITVNAPVAGVLDTIVISSFDSFDTVEGYARQMFGKAYDGFGTQLDLPLDWAALSDAVNVAPFDNGSVGYITGVKPANTSNQTPYFVVSGPGGKLRTVYDFDVADSVPATDGRYEGDLELGTPADADASDDYLMQKNRFALSYNRNRGGPNWVSWTLNSTQFGANADRCNCFSQDPMLPASQNPVGPFDYLGSGYDKGHMVQSASRTKSAGENAQTFLMTNMLPQAGANNQGPWGKFENFLNDSAKAGRQVYVVAGGIYAANPPTLKGEGKVAIPDYTWKVAVMVNGDVKRDGMRTLADLKWYAVKMPNRTDAEAGDAFAGATANSGIRNDPWQKFQVTVDDIEAATGYDLLDLLPDSLEIPLEAGDHNAPVATLTAPVTSTTEGGALAFTAAGTDADGDALTYSWTIGSTVVGTGTNPTITFADNGTYTLTLTVSDKYGARDVKSVAVTVANAAPVVSLAADSVAITSGSTVAFSGAFSDAGVNDSPWQWSYDFGTGSPVTGSASVQGALSRSFSYLKAGSYTATLTVTDKDGASASRSVNVSVARLQLDAQVTPGMIQLNDGTQSNVAFTILGSRSFDVSLIDASTARIGNVGAAQKENGSWFVNYEDVNGDGITDAIIRFGKTELMNGGVLDTRTAKLTLVADLTDGRQVEASARVHTR